MQLKIIWEVLSSKATLVTIVGLLLLVLSAQYCTHVDEVNRLKDNQEANYVKDSRSTLTETLKVEEFKQLVVKKDERIKNLLDSLSVKPKQVRTFHTIRTEKHIYDTVYVEYEKEVDMHTAKYTTCGLDITFNLIRS